MPAPDPIKAQEFEKLTDYFLQNDPYSLISHMEEVAPTDFNSDDPHVQAFIDFVEALATSKDKAQEDFLLRMWSHMGTRSTELLMEKAKRAEDIKQHLMNQESEGLEALTTESEETIDRMSNAFAASKTESGRAFTRMNNMSSTLKWMGFYREDAKIPENLKDDCLKVFGEAEKKAWEVDKRFDEETKKRLKKAGDPVDSEFMLSSSKADVFSKNNLLIDADQNTGIAFKKVDNIYQHLKGLSNRQLHEYLLELESDLEHVRTLERHIQAFTEKSETFLKEMKEKTPENDKKTPAYEALEKLLEKRSGRKGSSYFHPQKEREELAEIKKAAENFPDKTLSAAILGAVADSEAAIKADLDNGLQAVYDKNGGLVKNSSPDQIELDIKRVQTEINHRKFVKDPDYSQIMQKNQMIEAYSKQQDELAGFKDKIRRSLYYTKQIRSVLKEDREGRKDLQDVSKHKDYFALTDKASALSDLDLENMTPRQILEKMKEAKAAADKYVGSHAGILNITKGWSDAGKQRITDATKISKTLDEQIKALEEDVNKYSARMGGKTFAEREAALERDKKLWRSEAIKLKQETMNEINQPSDVKIGNRINQYYRENAEFERTRSAKLNGTIMESASFVAARSLQKLSKAIHFKEPFTEEQKEQIVKHIGRIIAYDTRPFDVNKDMNEKKYKEFVGNLGKNKQFQEALKRTMGDITPRNLERFLTEPELSKEFAMNFADVRKESFDYDGPRPSKAPEIHQGNVEINQVDSEVHQGEINDQPKDVKEHQNEQEGPGAQI
ncbi:MAG: hypothetical protein J6P72_08825 [Firmicutes bacterium]|nr:hypothetical protein [Bacillota bacterium]